jgi:hypothetical protein
LQAVFEAAIPVALERAEPAIGYRIAMEAGLEDEAARIAAHLQGENRMVAEAAIAAWFGDQAAFDELHRIAAANPLSNAYVATCRRIASRSNDADWPFGWTGDCTGTGPFEYPAVRVGPPVEGRATIPGPDATWHHQYVYRRLAPYDEVVPGIPHLRSVYTGWPVAVSASSDRGRERPVADGSRWALPPNDANRLDSLNQEKHHW